MIRRILLLTPLVVAFALALDFYLPVVPDMVEIFDTSSSAVQLTLSIFMIMCGAGQLLIGPLSDEFGRKTLILFSTALFTLASLLAALSPNIEVFIALRALEAVGACGMLVTAFAYVRDVSHGTESGRTFSFLNGAIGLSPLLAPLIGGYLIYFWGWQAAFYALAVIGFLTLLNCVFNLKETHPAERRIKINRDLFCRYLRVLKNGDFIAYAFASTSGMTCFFTFFSVSPYILIKTLHVKMQDFGFYFGYVGLFYFVGSFLSAHIIERIGVKKTTLLGTLFLILAGLIQAGYYLLFGLNHLGFTAPMGIFGFGCAMAMGAGPSGALEPFPDIAGAASATMGALQFFTAFAVGTFVVLFPFTTALPMSLTLIVLGTISSLLIWRRSHTCDPTSS